MVEKPDLTDALKTLAETLNWPVRAVPQVVAVLDAFLDYAEERAETDFVDEPDEPEALSEPDESQDDPGEGSG